MVLTVENINFAREDLRKREMGKAFEELTGSDQGRFENTVRDYSLEDVRELSGSVAV